MCAICGSVGPGLCAEAMPDASSKAANAPANLTNTMMNLPVAATMAVHLHRHWMQQRSKGSRDSFRGGAAPSYLYRVAEIAYSNEGRSAQNPRSCGCTLLIAQIA